MQINQKAVTIAELAKGYKDSHEEGVVGYDGKLDIRPPYQREFVYNPKQRDLVIRSVLSGFPLNVMYWAVRDDDMFEVLDGQQRTISICQYVNGDFSLDGLHFHNQPADVRKRIDDYKLMVYACDGEPSEKLAWFEIVNLVGEALTRQELLNAIYAGPWLAAAKKYFSRPQCPGHDMSRNYVKVRVNRQELLEVALKWASRGKVTDYMGLHARNTDAEPLWEHFRNVIDWVSNTFHVPRPKIMPGVNWGELYTQHGNRKLDPGKLENEIAELISLSGKDSNKPITNISGIYPYVLDDDETHLHLRTFDKVQMQKAFENQGEKCKKCGGKFPIKDMEGDHITPWREGGLTTDGNLQMLCRPCNRKKG